MDERIRTDSDFGVAVRRDAGEPAGIANAPWPGIEQSLASIVLGSVFALAAPTIAFLVEFLQDHDFARFDRVAVGAAGVAGVLGGLFVVTACVFGLVFGVMGMAAARRQRRSGALGLAGIFLNGLDVVTWLGLIVAWVLAVLGHH